MPKAETEIDRSGNAEVSERHDRRSTENRSGRSLRPPATVKGRKRKRFVAKAVIYRESEPVDRVYLIRNGLVKLLSYLPNGRARIVRLHAKGHWIGLEGLMGHAYEHTAIAVGDVEVEYYPAKNLQRLHQDSPIAFGKLLCHWHTHLIQADKWIADFSTGEIKPRVARFLGYLAELEYGELPDRVELLKVHEIADALGVTQESVSRILADFKRNKVLQKSADPLEEIYRLNTEKLQQEATL